MKSDKILLIPFYLPLENSKVLETVSDTQAVSNLLDFEITKVISMEDKKLQNDGGEDKNIFSSHFGWHSKKFSSDLLGTSSIKICLSTHACNGAAMREDSHSLIVIHHYSLQK